MAVEIVMPRLSDSMEEGTIVAWLVAEGDRIEPGQPLAEIETDKATVAYESESAGVVLALKVGDGACVPVGSPIAVIGDVDERLARGSGAVATVAAMSVAAVPGSRPDRPKASPLARRLAAELNVDLAALSGSGPLGRVIRADVDRAAAARSTPRTQPIAVKATADTGPSERHELTRLQRTVARRMTESRATVPDIELRVEVDMGEAVALRDRLREVADPCPTLNDLVVKAVALALRQFPRVNGAYRDGAIETFSRVNIGIAVAADDALVVPTIFDADRMSLGELSKTAREAAARVRDGSITPAELAGGTFTVSNLGMYGVDSFSAVINSPQAAILAVGAIRRRPVVDEPSGALVARPTVLLTLACDHRILYGADGARFLGRVRDLLERPHALLL